MANLARYTAPLFDLDTYFIYDDFTEDIATARWITTVVGTTPTAAVGDASGGIMVLTTTATDNDEVNIEYANEIFLFAANRPLYARARLQFSEAATSAANIGFGFLDGVAAETLIDNGAGIAATKDGAVIYKVDGETVWSCFSGNGANRTVTKSTTTAGGSAYQVLEINIVDFDGVSMAITFKVDGDYLKDSTGAIIRHTVLIASATEMTVFFAAKAGSTNIETLNIDYVYASQKR